MSAYIYFSLLIFIYSNEMCILAQSMPRVFIHYLSDNINANRELASRLGISIELPIENSTYEMFNDYYSKLKRDKIVAVDTVRRYFILI